MATSTLIPSGDFRTSYAADTTIFPTATSRNFAIAGIVLACFAPMLLSNYLLSIAIQIGIFAIAALGLNVLVGFTGQISIGHAAFFLFGAFTSVGGLMASLLVFAILLSVFFDAMGVSVGLAREAGTVNPDGSIPDLNRVLAADALAVAITHAHHRQSAALRLRVANL
mgnify:CR=1 FL=1